MQIEKKLEELNIQLPPTPEPAAVYIPAVLVGDLVFVSGQTPKDGNTLVYKGKIGQEVSLEEGYAAARICILRCLSALKSIVGDLDKVERIVKLTGYVNCIDTFTAHPQVINGASDLLEQVFGEKGRHARAAVGVNSLPGHAAVEIELIAQVTNVCRMQQEK